MIDRHSAVAGVAAATIGVAYYFLVRRRRALAATCCCPPGSLPPLTALAAEETPARGREQELGGLTVYATGVWSRKRCVIVATDIWGFRAGRHRQVCDCLADSLGCAVYMPDLFHGDACTPDKGPGTDNFKPWAKQWTPTKVGRDLDALMATVSPSCKVGVVGFCWGRCVHKSHSRRPDWVVGLSGLSCGGSRLFLQSAAQLTN